MLKALGLSDNQNMLQMNLLGARRRWDGKILFRGLLRLTGPNGQSHNE